MHKSLAATSLFLSCAMLFAASNLTAANRLNEIDLNLTFNLPVEDDLTKGFGGFLGYRMVLPSPTGNMSFGVRFGMFFNTLESSSDTVSKFPFMAVFRYEKPLGAAKRVSVYGDAGVGYAINNIRGDTTDSADLNLKDSFATQIEGGVLYKINEHFRIGGALSYYYSEARIEFGTLNSEGDVHLGHFGISFATVITL